MAAVWLALACVVAALVTWLVGEPQAVEALMGETGPVERLTAGSYAACAAAVWLARRPGDDWRSSLALCTLMLGFCARELDWHKAFTGTSVLRVSWYAGPAPASAKLLAATAVLTVGSALVWLVWRHARRVWRAAWRHEPVAATVVVFVLTLVIAKSLDRSVGILVQDFGVSVSLYWVSLRSALEEWMELSLALLVLLGLAQHRAGDR